MILCKYQSVPANTIVSEEFIVASGKTLAIECMAGNAVYSQDVCVVFLWANEIVCSTHGDFEWECGFEFDGDGEKALKMELRNNSSQAETFGGYVQGGY